MNLKFYIDNVEYQIGVNPNNGGPRVERVDGTPISKMSVCKTFLRENGWTEEMFLKKNTITLENAVARILRNKNCNTTINDQTNFLKTSVKKNNVKIMRNKEINTEVLLSAIKEIVNEDVTLKDNIKLENLLELKNAISPINNLITSELTKKLIIKLKDILPNISDEKIKSLLNDNEYVNVNANGYDFKDDEIKVIAEVKGNKPYKYVEYGAGQIKELDKDIEGLLLGKSKEERINPNNYYKILVQLKYEKDNYSSKTAIESFIKNNKYSRSLNLLKLLNDGDKVDSKEFVYIILLDI